MIRNSRLDTKGMEGQQVSRKVHQSLGYGAPTLRVNVTGVGKGKVGTGT